MLVRTYLYLELEAKYDEMGRNTTARESDIYYSRDVSLYDIVEYYKNTYNPYLVQSTIFGQITGTPVETLAYSRNFGYNHFMHVIKYEVS